MSKPTHLVIADAAALKTPAGEDLLLERNTAVDTDIVTPESLERSIRLGQVEAVDVTDANVTPEAAELDPYAGVTVPDLRNIIAARNETREDDTRIQPAQPGNRPELVAALIDDDARTAEATASAAAEPVAVTHEA